MTNETIKLSDEDKQIYGKLVERGDTQGLFEFGYLLGQIEAKKEIVNELMLIDEIVEE